MKRYLLVLFMVSSVISGPTFAHARLSRSQPADQDSSPGSPREVVLEFSEPVQVTTLTLEKESEKARYLGPLPQAATVKITVPIPTIGTGDYIVKWRAVGDDNHVLHGEFTFTIAAS